MASDERVAVECICGKGFSIGPGESISCECEVVLVASAAAPDGRFKIARSYYVLDAESDS